MSRQRETQEPCYRVGTPMNESILNDVTILIKSLSCFSCFRYMYIKKQYRCNIKSSPDLNQMFSLLFSQANETFGK